MPKPKLHPFDLELIASIQNERRQFNMRCWVIDPKKDLAIYNEPATCGTASCMAGHIEALRRPMAKRLLATGEYSNRVGLIDHEELAREIYRRVTGKECQLDFVLFKTSRVPTRKAAIAHIRGTNSTWPQLDQ